MLQTIEVEIDKNGRIHPLETLSFIPSGRAYLTLLASSSGESRVPDSEPRNAANALKLLASPRFAHRPLALADEVRRRIADLRNDW